MIKSYKSLQISLFILVVAIITSCGGQSNSHELATNTDEPVKQSKIEKLDELIGDYAEYGKFNGSVLVAEEGKIIYQKGFGLANMEWDISNETDTKFRIASITKQFTAMLIVQLVSENKLDLHVPISTYLPDYPAKNADRITIHHLLTHSSGTPEFDDFINYRDIERDRYRPEQMLKIFADGELQFTPGERFSYTNTGYVILGVIIEKITGKSYEQVLQEKIFTPLEMHNSGYDLNYVVLKERATGYVNRYGRNDYMNANYVDMSIPFAAGSIYSTVEDLYLWDQALYSAKLLPRKFRDLLFGKYISAYGDRHYGYGWIIGGMQVGKTGERVETIGHSGGINGFRTMIIRIPSTKSSIILLSNTDKAPLFELTIAINGILYDKPYDPKKSIAYSLVEVAKNDGVESGIAYFNKIKNSMDYYIDVDEMNIAGYELLHSNKTKEAALLFELNVEAFSNSFIPYDSYGDFLLQQGNEKEAIENYKKSVELNPNNKGGISILKKLGVE